MKRVFNFSAGPSMLPMPVLEKAQADMLDYNSSGMSVMEMSHRSPVYDEIIKNAEAKLRELMNISDNYKVLFLQGGASTQFAAVPLNLMNKNKKADYILSGQFSTKAFKEAQKYGDVVAAASSKDDNFSRIPETTRESFRPDADYVHICYNNTIYGTKYNYIPDTGDIPLVADMSSCIISEPVDVSRFGLIYAGAQKNMAPAGLTLVIVREDLIGNARETTPAMLDYKLMAENGIEMGRKGPAFQTNVENVWSAGDAHRGPATVVEGIADAAAFAEAVIGKAHTYEIPEQAYPAKADAIAKKGILKMASCACCEGGRCLDCNTVCENCVDSCPNRANVVVKLADGRHEIVHVDKMCNECGNCTQFCPYASEPCHDKFTLFQTEKDMNESENRGVLFLGGDKIRVRLEKDEVLDLSQPNELPQDIETLILTLRGKYSYLYTE